MTNQETRTELENKAIVATIAGDRKEAAEFRARLRAFNEQFKAERLELEYKQAIARIAGDFEIARDIRRQIAAL